jgi:tetratricopeptide (TPR) repeat protein
MTTSHLDHAAAARELEADLERYPDERGEILLEAADAWKRAGDRDRAITLLTEAVALAGDDGAAARVTLADVYFEFGDAERAHAQLDDLRRDRPPSPMAYHLAAELLEARGELDGALTWFGMAMARLTEEELAELGTDHGPFTEAGTVLAGRRRVREALGLPADEWDERIDAGTGELRAMLERAARATAGPQGEARILFWPRDEVPEAHRTWPQVVQHRDEDAYATEREAANRELAATGTPRITMVPLTVAALQAFCVRTGRDPAESDTRIACMDELVARGAVISWPPARNAPCWCGSNTKYKKCCGRPGGATR